MKNLFWGPVVVVVSVLGFVGFCFASILVMIGLCLHHIAEGLGMLFDWYQIQYLRMVKRVIAKMD